MHSYEKLLHLANVRKVSDTQFIKLFNQLNLKNPITLPQFEDLLQDASNEYYLIVISFNYLPMFWKSLPLLPINQQLRILKRYQLKILLVKSVDVFVSEFIEYCDGALATKSDHLINTLILTWDTIFTQFPLVRESEAFKKFVAKLVSFLSANNYVKQVEYCNDKFKSTFTSLNQLSNLKNPNKTSFKLNNVNVNVTSKNYSNFENFKIFYLFNNYYFKNFNIPANEVIFTKFNKDFNGDCYKLIYSIFLGINLSVKTNQLSYIQNNWLMFLNSRLPKIILLYKVDNLEEIIAKIFENFPNFALSLKQNFIKSLIFNKILSIKSFHKFFPNEIKVNQQNLIHEMSNINSVDKFNEALNDKLYNVNCEFISLEESNLIDYFNKILGKIEFSMAKQIELTQAIEHLTNLLIDELSFEKLNRLILIILHNNRLFNLLMFNLNSKSIIFKLINLIDNDQFKIDDNSFQDFYSYFGNVLLFIIKISNYVNLEFKLKNSFTLNYLTNFRMNYLNLTKNYSNENSKDDADLIVNNYETLVNEWIRSLFDEDTDGLSDELIKSIDVKQIYQLIPIIFQQAIMAFIEGKITLKILLNGLDYLSQNFLLPCNLSIINWLILRINLKNSNLGNYMKVLNEMIRLINSVKLESNNELKLTSEILLDLICDSLRDINQLNVTIDNVELMNKINQNNSPTNFKDLNFEEFEENLIRGFNGFTDINYKFIDYYINHHKSLIKSLIIMLNNGNHGQGSNNNDNLKFLIDFVIYVNLLASIKNNAIKTFWIDKFDNLVIENPTEYKVSQDFEISMDYHYSSIFNQDGEEGEDEEARSSSEEFEYCINETYKYSNDLIEFFNILVKFKRLTENESFLRSINLIHNKLLTDLKNFNAE